MNKKLVAVLAAMVMAAAFAAKFPSYLEVSGTTVTGYTDDVPANLVIPNGITKIADSAFMFCLPLKSVTVPGSVRKIDDYAFAGTSLVSVTISNGVTEIGDNAFDCCKSLTSVTIPNGITEISDDMFSGCKSLASVSIPNGVTEIGGSAFWGCKSLTNVAIPRSVTKIGVWAFTECNKNLKIQYGGTKAQWNAVQKEGFDIGNFTVQCTDGDITN